MKSIPDIAVILAELPYSGDDDMRRVIADLCAYVETLRLASPDDRHRSDTNSCRRSEVNRRLVEAERKLSLLEGDVMGSVREVIEAVRALTGIRGVAGDGG